MLFIHDVRLLVEDPINRQHQAAGTLPLKAGWHPIRYQYRTSDKTAEFDLTVTGPNGKPLLLQAENIGSHFPVTPESP